jgi:hypothetical protein
LEQQSIVYLCQGRETIIEGVVYYDVEKIRVKDRKRTQRVNRSITTREKNKGANARTKRKEKKEYHCDSEELQ